MLSTADLALLEGTLLPALERHDLRLLAHGLRTFQAIARATAVGASPIAGVDPPHPPLPDRGQIEAWAASQSTLADDPGFQAAFLEQLTKLRARLVAIAAPLGRPPLDLRIEDLVTWATTEADARLNRSAANPVPASAGPPPS
jgi:hypothetical protein